VASYIRRERALGGDTVTGIHYVTDEEGRKIAAQIDLRKHAELWEEIEDVLISESPRNETSIPIEQVRTRLIQRDKLRV
jgi:hypothetical protein